MKIPMTEKLQDAITKMDDISELLETLGADKAVKPLSLEDRECMFGLTYNKTINELLRSVYLNGIPFRVEGLHKNRMIMMMNSRNSDHWSSDYYKKQIEEGASIFEASLTSPKVVGGDMFDLGLFMSGEQYYIIPGSYLYSCGNCGSKFDTKIMWDVEKDELVFVTEDSPCFDTSIDHHLTLNFKAGDEILFGDWLGGPRDSGFNLNTEKGTYQNSLFYSRYNIGYVQVGNSCPSVYRDGDLIYIGLPKGKKPSELQKLGSICTDLWATCFSTERDIRESIKGEFDDEQEGDAQIERGEVFLTLDKDTKFEVAIHPHNEHNYLDEDGEEYSVSHYATIRMV